MGKRSFPRSCATWINNPATRVDAPIFSATINPWPPPNRAIRKERKVTKQTARELLDIAANDIKEIDLSNYLGMYQINNIANQLIRASALLGEELFNDKKESAI